MGYESAAAGSGPAARVEDGERERAGGRRRLEAAGAVARANDHLHQEDEDEDCGVSVDGGAERRVEEAAEACPRVALLFKRRRPGDEGMRRGGENMWRWMGSALIHQPIHMAVPIDRGGFRERTEKRSIIRIGTKQPKPCPKSTSERQQAPDSYCEAISVRSQPARGSSLSHMGWLMEGAGVGWMEGDSMGASRKGDTGGYRPMSVRAGVRFISF